MLILQAETQEAVARAVGVRQQSVSAWASGESIPGYPARRALRDKFGIAVDAWDEAAAEGVAAANHQHADNMNGRPRWRSPTWTRLLCHRWRPRHVRRARPSRPPAEAA